VLTMKMVYKAIPTAQVTYIQQIFYPVNSSSLAIRSSFTIFSAFLVANSSLFSEIRFSTSLPMPKVKNKSK